MKIYLEEKNNLRNIAIIFLLLCSGVALNVSPTFAASPPSAPQYMEAMAGSSQVAVTWEAPSSNGGETSLKYTVRVWTLPPPTASPVFASCTTTSFGCVISGLVSGTVYYVDVVAVNSAGTGAPSAARSISPGAAGSPPNSVSAAIDAKGLMTVKWAPLTSFSGATFAWYHAEAFTSPEISIGSYSGYCTDSSISASSCLIGGLKSGVNYYVQVRTISSVGSSYPSSPRFLVAALASLASSSTPSPTQSSSGSSVKLTAPQQVKVVALFKAVRVTWKAPSVTGGKTILNYSVGVFSPSGAAITTCKTMAKLFYCTINGLKALQKVYVGVTARYSDGLSPVSKLIAVTPKS